jgi:hypothetical protein
LIHDLNPRVKVKLVEILVQSFKGFLKPTSKHNAGGLEIISVEVEVSATVLVTYVVLDVTTGVAPLEINFQSSVLELDESSVTMLVEICSYTEVTVVTVVVVVTGLL